MNVAERMRLMHWLNCRPNTLRCVDGVDVNPETFPWRVGAVVKGMGVVGFVGDFVRFVAFTPPSYAPLVVTVIEAVVEVKEDLPSLAWAFTARCQGLRRVAVHPLLDPSGDCLTVCDL